MATDNKFYNEQGIKGDAIHEIEEEMTPEQLKAQIESLNCKE